MARVVTADVDRVICPDCDGDGVIPAGTFAPRADTVCDRCDGFGSLDADELDGEP